MAAKSVQISIPNIKLESHKLYLIGSAPLIVHAFAEKSRKEMLEKQMKVAKGGRDARDPYAEVEAAKYLLHDEEGNVVAHGFPAVAFKAAAVTACTSLSDVTKVAARQAFRVEGMASNNDGVLANSFIRTAVVPIVYGQCRIREDIVRLSGIGRTAEVRYRPEYSPWGVELDIVLNPQVISIGQLGSMFQAAGHGVGVGEYRPERNGDCGTFDVVGSEAFEGWREENGI